MGIKRKSSRVQSTPRLIKKQIWLGIWGYWRTVFFRYAPITKLLQRKVNIIYYSAIYKTRNTGIENGMSGMHGARGMFTMIPGSLWEDSGECSHFSIPENARKDSRKCPKRFWGMFQRVPRMLEKILGNIIKDSEECSRGFVGRFKKFPGNV